MAASTATLCRAPGPLPLNSTSNPLDFASSSSDILGIGAAPDLQRRSERHYDSIPGELLVLARSHPPKKESAKIRNMRMRKKLNGTSDRPRLAVFRSNQHVYAQVIDDTRMHTLAAGSTLLPAVREELDSTMIDSTLAAAWRVGELIAQQCLNQGITKVAFDRGAHVHHGRVRALADGARAGGLDF